MKTKDIQTGVIYAHNPRTWGTPDRAVALSTDKYRHNRPGYNRQAYIPDPKGGILVAVAEHADVDDATLLGVTLEDARKIMRSKSRYGADTNSEHIPAGVRIEVRRPQELKGEYQAFIAAQDAERKAADDARRQADALRAERERESRARYNRLAVVLGGTPHYAYYAHHTSEVVLSGAEFEKIMALIDAARSDR
jgi:hypothetical protein